MEPIITRIIVRILASFVCFMVMGLLTGDVIFAIKTGFKSLFWKVD